MPPIITEILEPYQYTPERVERIAPRAVKPPILIKEPDPEWRQRFETVKERIQTALGAFVLEIAHTGSTSIPGLPAKDIIDIDLSVKDATDESSYVQPLEDVGFQFLIREPGWHQHRFFAERWPSPHHFNLHVWGPDCPEVVRHRIFRDWLLKTPADLELYASVKREAAAETATIGDSMIEYNQRKESTIREILQRAFRNLGYID